MAAIVEKAVVVFAVVKSEVPRITHQLGIGFDALGQLDVRVWGDLVSRNSGRAVLVGC